MKADKQKINRLLKTARGQLDGILKMVEADQYCMDISCQLAAAQAILKKANQEIIRAHIQSCVRESLTQGDPEEAEKKIEELTKVIGKL